MDEAAVLAFRDTSGDAPRTIPPPPGFAKSRYISLANSKELGAVYGLAYDWRRSQLYASAFANGRSHLGAGGPGAIYRIDVATGEAALWATLDAAAAASEQPITLVGKTSIGDIDLDEAATVLFVVSLPDRRIHRFSVPDGGYMGSFAHGAENEPWSGNARPFGLGYRDGWLYHGVVDSRENTELPGALALEIYRSRGDGSEMSPVASLDLDYRDAPQWHRWEDDPAPPIGNTSQPMVVDIEFRPNGDPIIGMRDRIRTTWVATTKGDILPSRRIGPGSWRIIAEPEYYFDDLALAECAQGALAAFPGRDIVVATSVLTWSGVGGAVWYDNRRGDVATELDSGVEHLFGEEFYAGDLESLCPPQRPVYLPLTGGNWCRPRGQVDVILVVDMSSSMAKLSTDGLTKYEAAVAASRQFVGYLRMRPQDPTSDRVAVVGFNNAAWIESDLSADTPSIATALDRLPERIQEGTRLDLALKTAWEAADSRSGSAAPGTAVILLTDGVPNRVPPGNDGRPETTVLAAADGLKAVPVQLYTIGFGAPGDINEVLLRGVASQPSMYYYAPSAEELLRIYRQIAAAIDCP